MREIIIDDEKQYLVLLSGSDKEVKKDIQYILKNDKEVRNEQSTIKER